MPAEPSALPASPPSAEGGDDSAGHRERLRSRFIEAPEALPDYELLELLLFAGIPRRDTKPIAKALMRRWGSLGAVLAAEPLALKQEGGLGPAAVAALKAVHAAAQRIQREEVREQPLLGSMAALLSYLRTAMQHEKVEQFRLILLDKRNRLIADEVQHTGTVDATPAYPREIVRRCLELNATALIMVHNHPSGDPNPSRDDIETTKRVHEAVRAVGIVLHDHIIIGRRGHASFRELGLL